MIQAFACTSETLAGFQSTFPKTLGRSLVSGFLPADALDASRSDGLKKSQGMNQGNPSVCHNAPNGSIRLPDRFTKARRGKGDDEDRRSAWIGRLDAGRLDYAR